VELRPLVLVPGLLCDAAVWQPQTDGLGDAAETWIPDHGRHDDMRALAAAVLREAPFERFALAGFSMGGYIALAMMAQAPERIDRLALVDTSARPDTAERIEARLRLIELAERGRFSGVVDVLLPLMVHPSRIADAPLIATIRDMARRTGKEAFVRQEQAIMSRADSRPGLAAIRCPTLVLCGREDQLTPLDGHEEMAAAMRGLPIVGVNAAALRLRKARLPRRHPVVAQLLPPAPAAPSPDAADEPGFRRRAPRRRRA
jgi:pimeloyl-ACP methyl ester carboxylesterase